MLDAFFSQACANDVREKFIHQALWYVMFELLGA